MERLKKAFRTSATAASVCLRTSGGDGVCAAAEDDAEEMDAVSEDDVCDLCW